MRLTTCLAVTVSLYPALGRAANVRSDRPRLLVSNGRGPGTSLATFKQRCTSDAGLSGALPRRAHAGERLFPAIALAAGYVVNGDASQCAAAYTKAQSVAADTPGQPDDHSFISNNGRTMLQLAVVRDWCDPVLSADREAAGSRPR